jgi:hypothetical protein
MREHGERCGFAVLMFELGEIGFPRLALRDKEHGRFRERPAQVDGANLVAGRAQFFATGFFGACPQATRGDKILDTGKAANVLTLIEDTQRQDLPNPRHGL